MTREEFIQKLEKMGLVRYEDTAGTDYWQHEALRPIRIINNKDLFLYANNIYNFDELEQFLIENRIVDKPFDADEYLLSKGFILDRFSNQYKKGAGIIRINDGRYEENNPNNLSIWINCHFIMKVPLIAKQSIDKAIKLVDFLIKLEKE